VYKAAVRFLIRRNIARLNVGRAGPALAMFADDATLTFPGDNSWSRQFREPGRGRAASPSHRGRPEIEAFVRRYVEHGIQMEVEDVLVNGPPWNTRVAVCVHDWIPGPDGRDVYANRAVLRVHARWGRITTQEDYEDTERVRAYDSFLSTSVTPRAGF
jgi:ketosteroid isomerase-like protein